MGLTVVETQRSEHASEAVQKLELGEEMDAVVCVGGDGTMSEIIQVLLPSPCAPDLSPAYIIDATYSRNSISKTA
jgi:diacylglycerol kinase family enzyme